MTDKDQIFLNIANDIKKIGINGLSNLTLLQAKQSQIDQDILKFVFEFLIDKYDTQSLEIFFNNNYNYTYDHNYENYVICKQNYIRNFLINKYIRCIITDKSYMLCDAVFILSLNELSKYTNEPIKYRYEPENALLLCRDLCALFMHPKKYLKINPSNLTVELSDEILNDPNCKEYHKYHNKKINCVLSNKTIIYLTYIYT